jgi:hypothetical protein
MRFTDTNIVPTEDSMIPAESGTEMGHLLPSQIGAIATHPSEVTVAMDYEITAPAGSVDINTARRLFIKSTGGGQLTKHASILLPSDSAIAFPKSLTAGKTTIVQITYGPMGWALTSLIGEY